MGISNQNLAGRYRLVFYSVWMYWSIWSRNQNWKISLESKKDGVFMWWSVGRFTRRRTGGRDRLTYSLNSNIRTEKKFKGPAKKILIALLRPTNQRTNKLPKKVIKIAIEYLRSMKIAISKLVKCYLHLSCSINRCSFWKWRWAVDRMKRSTWYNGAKTISTLSATQFDSRKGTHHIRGSWHGFSFQRHFSLSVVVA